jgi:hypothetical protein
VPEIFAELFNRLQSDFDRFHAAFRKAEVFMERLVLAAVLIAVNSPSIAAPSCKEWVRQSNGSQMRSCIGDGGKAYCETCTGTSCLQTKCDNDNPPPQIIYNPPRRQPPPS